MIERLRLKPKDPVADLIRRSSKRKADLDLRHEAAPFADQELIEAMAAPTVIALFADDGEREMIIHQGTHTPSAKLVVFKDRVQAALFVAGAHSYHNAGSKAALTLIEIRENLNRS
jgi:hypothetical protein